MLQSQGLLAAETRSHCRGEEREEQVGLQSKVFFLSQQEIRMVMVMLVDQCNTLVEDTLTTSGPVWSDFHQKHAYLFMLFICCSVFVVCCSLVVTNNR